MKKLKMVVVLSMIMFFLGNIIYIEALDFEGKIHKNVYIENLDLSGLTKSEAKLKLDKIVNENNDLKLSYGEKIYTIKLSELNIIYKIDEMIDEAYSVGRGNGIISNLKMRMKLDMGETYVISLEYSYDNKSLEDYFSYLQNEINKEPISATIKIDNDTIVIQKETYGVKVDIEKLNEIILKKAETLFYETDELPVIQLKPTHLYEELSKINTILGSFETKFNKNMSGRVNNIYVTAQATSNILLSKQEEFSFNNYTSDKTFISKLKRAPVIRNGKLEDGLGGGMCQVSTTIYNAALYSGLEITNVRNHSIPSSYIEKGRDATVSSGNLDLKFKNNFDTPVLIYNKVYEDRIVSTIYGSKDDKKDIDIVTEVVEVLPKNTKYIDSDELYIGQKEIKQKGRVGYKVNTFRIYKNTSNQEKEFIFESYYPPVAEEILQGTKVKEIQPKPRNYKENNNKPNDNKGTDFHKKDNQYKHNDINHLDFEII